MNDSWVTIGNLQVNLQKVLYFEHKYETIYLYFDAVTNPICVADKDRAIYTELCEYLSIFPEGNSNEKMGN